jgi:AcrR family transcriptional regulator
VPGDSQQGPNAELPGGGERARVLTAITRAIGEHGFVGLSTDQILGHAGVSRATFESHFESKEQCIIAAQDDFLQDLYLEVSGACSAGRGWSANVRAGLDAGLSYIVELSALARVFAVEAPAATLGAHERQFATLDVFAALLREGRVHYPVAADMPAATERALVGGVASIVSDRLLSEEPRILLELRPDLVELVLMPYVGREEAHKVART